MMTPLLLVWPKCINEDDGSSAAHLTLLLVYHCFQLFRIEVRNWTIGHEKTVVKICHGNNRKNDLTRLGSNRIEKYLDSLILGVSSIVEQIFLLKM